MRTIRRLEAGSGAKYRSKPVEKKAALEWNAARYELSWGAQEFPGPHMRVADPGGDYGVDTQVFHATHTPVPGKPDHYVKSVLVRALRVTEATEIVTEVRGREEQRSVVPAGAWVVQNPGGEIYYNSAEEFAKRYEPAEPISARPKAPTLAEHLAPGSPKRILALDGGGIRGRLTLGILKAMEAIIGPLHDYFDLIGGTSTGSIIASGLAMGWDVDRLIDIYDSLGAEVFKPNIFRPGLWQAKFPTEPLERALEANFGAVRLGDPAIKTGLCIVAKRLDTNSIWPLHNNPKGRYYPDPPPGRNHVANRKFLLRQLVRASCAAPHYFDPELIEVLAPQDAEAASGAFVDGGASPHNNPALQLVLLATLKGYGFGWDLGADKLKVVSVGTGTWEVKNDPVALLDAMAVDNARRALLSVMDDCSWLNELMMQWLSVSPTARDLDREIRTLDGDVLGGGEPWLTYFRYNAPIELEWLTENLPGAGLDATRLEGLRAMDNARSLDLLGQIGTAAGKQVKKEHFD